jgi:integrase
MAKKRNGKLRRVRECIYERNGAYVVTMADGQGGKLWKGGLRTIDEAVDARSELRAQKKRLAGKQADETIGSFAERWARDFPRPSAGTNIHNAQMVQEFGRRFADVRLSEFSGEQARRFALEKPSDAIRVRTMFQDAVRYRVDGLERNPFEGIVIPKSRGRQDITVLTPQELATLKAIAVEVHGQEYGPLYGAMIDVSAWTGMRPGELFALSWHDIDFDEHVIHVDWALKDKTGEIGRPKGRDGGKVRTIALTRPAEQALRTIQRLDGPSPVVERGAGKERHPAPLVFATKRGRPMTHRNHSFYWDPVRKAFYQQAPEHRKPVIGVDLDFYELRHFCGSYLGDRGVSPYDIAQHMGHADGGRLAMKIYIHVGEAASRGRIRDLWRDEGDEGREATG